MIKGAPGKIARGRYIKSKQTAREAVDSAGYEKDSIEQAAQEAARKAPVKDAVEAWEKASILRRKQKAKVYSKYWRRAKKTDKAKVKVTKARKKLVKAEKKQEKKQVRYQEKPTRHRERALNRANRKVDRKRTKYARKEEKQEKALEKEERAGWRVLNETKFTTKIKRWVVAYLIGLVGVVGAIAVIVIAFAFMMINLLASVVAYEGALMNSQLLSGDAQAVYRELKSAGFNDVEISGIMGNMCANSAGELGKIDAGNNGGSGLLPNSDKVRREYVQFRIAHQDDVPLPSDAELQVRFIIQKYNEERSYENNEERVIGWKSSAHKYVFENAQTPEAAAYQYYQCFENWQSHPDDETNFRREAAADFYQKILISNMAGTALQAPSNERLQWLFPNGVPQDEATLSSMMVWIEIPMYQLDGSVKYGYLQCHPKLQTEIIAAFREMVAIGFPVEEASCYGYRQMNNGTGTNSLSHHSYGVAIDINWTVNPHISWGYSPDPSSPYYINQAVINIWQRHGFYWGGYWEYPYTDWMHFSYTDQ